MSQKIGGTFIIEEQAPEKCEECGNIDELRPYGENGKKICHPCAEKDWDNVQKRMDTIIHGASKHVFKTKNTYHEINKNTVIIGDSIVMFERDPGNST